MKDRVDFGYDTLPDDLSLDDYLPDLITGLWSFLWGKKIKS